MYQIKLNGIKYDIPSSIDEITIGKLMEFRKIGDDYSKFLFWGIGAEPHLTEEHEHEVTMAMSLISMVSTEIYEFFNGKERLQLPESITVLGEEIKLSKGLINDLPYWGYERAKQVVIKHGKIYQETEVFDPTDDIPSILAHYLYTYCTKRQYNESEAEKFIDEINDMKMKEAIQLGGFFLRKHKDLFPSNKKPSKLKLIRNT